MASKQSERDTIRGVQIQAIDLIIYVYIQCTYVCQIVLHIFRTFKDTLTDLSW